MSWRRTPDVELPDVNTGGSTIVEITTKIVTPHGEHNVYHLDGLPSEETARKDLCLVFLHGMRFTSANWRQLGTIQLFSNLGYRVIAVDIPGYGATGGERLSRDHAAVFLERFITALEINNAIIISPSMSGMFSLPYILQSPEAVCGYVPVAPVDTELYKAEQYKTCKVPTMIVHGQNDNILGRVSTDNLSALAISEVTCVEDAGHACYLDKPNVWHRHLYNFLLNIAM